MDDKLLKTRLRAIPLDATGWRPGDFPLGSAQSRAAARAMLINRQSGRQPGVQSAYVRDAVRDVLNWLQHHTETKDPHWREAGANSPYRSFPDKPYFRPIIETFNREPIVFVCKSRDLMLSLVSCWILHPRLHDNAGNRSAVPIAD